MGIILKKGSEDNEENQNIHIHIWIYVQCIYSLLYEHLRNILFLISLANHLGTRTYMFSRKHIISNYYQIYEIWLESTCWWKITDFLSGFFFKLYRGIMQQNLIKDESCNTILGLFLIWYSFFSEMQKYYGNPFIWYSMSSYSCIQKTS